MNSFGSRLLQETEDLTAAVGKAVTAASGEISTYVEEKKKQRHERQLRSAEEMIDQMFLECAELTALDLHEKFPAVSQWEFGSRLHARAVDGSLVAEAGPVLVIYRRAGNK